MVFGLSLHLHKSLFCLASVLILLLFVATAQAQSNRVIRLTTQSLPPFQLIDKDGNMTGSVVERVGCALDTMGRDFEFHMMTWGEAQRLVRNKKFDGFFAGSAKADRSEFAVMSDPVVIWELFFYVDPRVNITDPLAEDQRSIARYGAKFATSKWRTLKENGYNITAKPRDVMGLIDMLKAGQIDVAYEYDLIMQHAAGIRGIDLDQFKKFSSKMNPQGVHFSKEFLAAEPDYFMDDFNAALASCIKRN